MSDRREVERLREVLALIERYSSDPSAVREAHTALNPPRTRERWYRRWFGDEDRGIYGGEGH